MSVPWQTRALAALPATVTISIMILTWVLMGELIQGLQNGWNKPWFVTYVIHVGYGIMLIPWLILRYRRIGGILRPKKSAGGDLPGDGKEGPAPVRELVVSTKQLFALALLLQIWSSAGGYTWYLSLPETLVSANNAIYQSASAFVFIISVFVIGETVTWPKIVAVITCIAGVAIVSAAPSASADDVHQTVGGYIWVIASTLLYSGYQVAYARYTEKNFNSFSDACCCCRRRSQPASETELEDREALLDTSGPGEAAQKASAPASSVADGAEIAAFMLGWMGAFTLVTQWPLFFIFNAAGTEPFVLPDAHRAGLLALSAFLDAVYNVSLLFGIIITSPLWMSLGTVLVVPGSIIADKILHNATLSGQAVAGILLIIVGFVVLQIPLPARWSKPVRCFWRRSDTQHGAAAHPVHQA